MIISKSAFLHNICKVFDDEECIITPLIPDDFLGWAARIAADAKILWCRSHRSESNLPNHLSNKKMLQLMLYDTSNVSLSQRYVIGSYTPTTYELHYFEELIFWDHNE